MLPPIFLIFMIGIFLSCVNSENDLINFFSSIFLTVTVVLLIVG